MEVNNVCYKDFPSNTLDKYCINKHVGVVEMYGLLFTCLKKSTSKLHNMKITEEKYVRECGFNSRILRCLEAANIDTLYQLTQYSRVELLKFRHFGIGSVNVLESRVNALGFKLKK